MTFLERPCVRSASPWATAAALAALLAAPAAAGPSVRVRAGESIQAAIDAARPGTVIEVEPGIYREALTVDTPGVTLRGLVQGGERPVLEGDGKRNDGVIASGSPFTMSGFRVQHYRGNGVSTQGVDGVVFRDLVVHDTGLYGVYPVQSRNISVTHCTVSKITDAAIYVGGSNRALVAYNEVFANVAGIEIENTNDAVVRDNLVYENTAGILAFVLPGKLQKEGLRSRIYRNWVVRNNIPNFGDPNSTVGQVPFGLGIMIMGADDTEVFDNFVKGNKSAGIAVVRLPEAQAKKDPPLEPHSDRTRIGSNYLYENGLEPHPGVTRDYGGGGDLAWDGTGVDNCASPAEDSTSVGVLLPPCLEPPGLTGRREPPLAPAPRASATSSPMPARAQAREAPVLPDGASVVRIRNMRFDPRHVTVARGDTVAWVNDDAVAHTVTSGHGTTPSGEPLDSPFLLRNDAYTHRFETAGVYEYLCLPHMDQASMRGATVTVTD